MGTISAFTGVRLDAGGNVTNSKGGSIDGSVGIGFGIGIEIMGGTGTDHECGHDLRRQAECLVRRWFDE